ncbi:MAG: tyrosine-type recombinase/integrase [Syntrophobacterales bacterium]|nr:tyrosine-type recombinase/integrase [Syntrophobacterales bacterium]
MKTNNGNQLRYLQRIGHSWYARVKVPPSLQPIVKNTHIRKALHTRDLDEANRRKWKVVEGIKAHLNRLKGMDASFQMAELFRRDLKKAYEENNLELAETLELVATDEAEKMFEKTGDLERAREWVARATTIEPSLGELIELWLADAPYTKQSKQQHRKAWEDLRHHLGGDSFPSKVTEDVAADYVENVLKKADKSYSTQRRQLNSLVAFWSWLSVKGHVPRRTNVWKGFRLSKRTAKQTEEKRPYDDNELITLFSGKPIYHGLADVMALGLYTGARLDELCSIGKQDVKPVKLPRSKSGYFLVSIRKAKTKAGIRTIPVVHPIPCKVLERRLASNDSSPQLFPEFAPGGYDGKLSWAVSKAFGRYKKSLGFTRATDFHSFRRTLVTLLENLGVDQIRIARYVGHEFPTLAAKVYSGGSTEKTNLEVARAIKYPNKVERLIEQFLARRKKDRSKKE